MRFRNIFSCICILFLVFLFSGCTARDKELKTALDSLENMESYRTTTTLTTSLYDIKKEAHTAQFFDGTAHTNAKITTDIWRDIKKLKGVSKNLIELTVYNKDIESKEDYWEIEVTTKYDYSNLEYPVLKSKLLFLKAPERFEKQVGLLDHGATYFEIDLAKIEGTSEYIRKTYSKKVPVLSSILKTFSWSSVAGSTYKLETEKADLNVFFTKLLTNTSFEYDKKSLQTLFDSITFGRANITRTLEDGKLFRSESSLRVTLDYRKYMNEYLGEPSGINLNIPYNLFATQIYSKHNAISEISYPTGDKVLDIKELNYQKFFPERKTIPTAPRQGKIKILRNNKGRLIDINFHSALPVIWQNGDIYYPAKYMFELKNYYVEEGENGVLYARNNDDWIEIYPDKNTYIKNKEKPWVRGTPVVIKGNLYVTGDVLCEVFGWREEKVTQDGVTTVTFYNK